MDFEGDKLRHMTKIWKPTGLEAAGNANAWGVRAIPGSSEGPGNGIPAFAGRCSKSVRPYQRKLSSVVYNGAPRYPRINTLVNENAMPLPRPFCPCLVCRTAHLRSRLPQRLIKRYGYGSSSHCYNRSSDGHRPWSDPEGEGRLRSGYSRLSRWDAFLSHHHAGTCSSHGGVASWR